MPCLEYTETKYYKQNVISKEIADTIKEDLVQVVEVGTAKDAKIDVNIIVEYGSRIPDVAFDIQNRVKTAVEGMTGLKVLAVNVHVQGVNTESITDEDSSKDSDKK